MNLLPTMQVESLDDRCKLPLQGSDRAPTAQWVSCVLSALEGFSCYNIEQFTHIVEPELVLKSGRLSPDS